MTALEALITIFLSLILIGIGYTIRCFVERYK